MFLTKRQDMDAVGLSIRRPSALVCHRGRNKYNV